MSKIISIGTALPAYRHDQQQIANFMKRVYQLDDRSASRISMVYGRSKIESRYSVIADFSLPQNEWNCFPKSDDLEPFPKLDERMKWYNEAAPGLAAAAIEKILTAEFNPASITHLITVSCTGMSAPGIDIALIKLLRLPGNCQRTSVNFMGCYAAIHGLKMADAICRADKKAVAIVVCVELCTIHFQKEPTPDNVASSLLFADGAAAVLVVADEHAAKGNQIESFYAELAMEGEGDMSWNLSEHGFLMHLSSYIPKLVEDHIESLLQNALIHSGKSRNLIARWAIHPGGKKILEAAARALALEENALAPSYDILKNYGNMSSVTILFVLKKIIYAGGIHTGQSIFAAAFGPGITIETMMLNGNKC
ncbi:MAG: type III polyketide synthase [Bacteroidota bacterium]